MKHLTVREPQSFGSEDALERVNESPLSATGGSLASSSLTASIKQSDQLPPPFSPCPGTTLCEGFPLTGPEPALVLPAGFRPQAGAPVLLRVGGPGWGVGGPACLHAHGRMC